MKDLAIEGAKRSHIALADLNALSWKEMIDKGMRTTATKAERKLWEDQFKILWGEWIAQNEAAGVNNAKEILDFWKSASDKAWAEHE